MVINGNNILLKLHGDNICPGCSAQCKANCPWKATQMIYSFDILTSCCLANIHVNVHVALTFMWLLRARRTVRSHISTNFKKGESKIMDICLFCLTVKLFNSLY